MSYAADEGCVKGRYHTENVLLYFYEILNDCLFQYLNGFLIRLQMYSLSIIRIYRHIHLVWIEIELNWNCCSVFISWNYE